jgi:asparagine synthase (glutamine-hydrolysing)
MCGIAGIVELRHTRAQREIAERMCRLLVHRGPDDEGFYVGDGVVLGSRRLAIIDLVGGRQPQANEDGTIRVVLNGEIYNFQDLRNTLQRRGHRFATSSDTEVLVHSYEEYGTEFLHHLRGMFAFALWDERKRQLLLARDRVGKKPLFYAKTENEFVFASELRALLAHPAVSRDIDPTAIDDYLTYGYIPAPKTIFRHVRKLQPGHFLTVQPTTQELSNQRYWHLEYTPPLDINEEEAGEMLLEQLTDAVRLRMIADVPLGALLSGGTDSSLVVALMSRLSSRPVKTFSIGFHEQEFNELPYARRVAEFFGTDHHEMVVTPSALEVLPILVRHYGEPFADSSAVPTYYVAKLTRQHVTVALNGDGGDECFAGYERYLGSMLAQRYRRIPKFLRKAVLEPVVNALPASSSGRSRFRQARRFIDAADQPFADRYLRWVTYFSPHEKQNLYTSAFRSELGGYESGSWLMELFNRLHVNGDASLDTLLAVDVQSYLPYDLLVKMDVATMANSLEARSPFLDHKLMEFCARLPSRYKLRNLTLKYLLKKVGMKLLPPANLYRRKMGFGVPVGEWLRGELRPMVDQLLLGDGFARRGYFQPAVVREIVARHTSGAENHAYKLWALLWLELWHREFVDGEV